MKLGKVELKWGNPERLGRRGLCPFCGYIGPPLLCGCVTEMYHALQVAEALLEQEVRTEQYIPVIHARAGQQERIRILNQALNAQYKATQR